MRSATIPPFRGRGRSDSVAARIAGACAELGQPSLASEGGEAERVLDEGSGIGGTDAVIEIGDLAEHRSSRTGTVVGRRRWEGPAQTSSSSTPIFFR